MNGEVHGADDRRDGQRDDQAGRQEAGRVTMSVAEAAAALGVPKGTVRRKFDAAGGAAGDVDEHGHRRVLRSWVAGEQARRQAARVPDEIAAWPSVAEVSRILDRWPATVRRWFDEDQPRSGRVLVSGRTGETERRFNPAWVAARKAALDAEEAARRTSQ